MKGQERGRTGTGVGWGGNNSRIGPGRLAEKKTITGLGAGAGIQAQDRASLVALLHCASGRSAGLTC